MWFLRAPPDGSPVVGTPVPSPLLDTVDVLSDEVAQIHPGAFAARLGQKVQRQLQRWRTDRDRLAPEERQQRERLNRLRLGLLYWFLHRVPDPAGESVQRAALCLSGGGIRSAAFALGLLQGLAERRLLTQFHYLSTVSGGGYIGTWLSSWLRRARPAPPDEVYRSLAQRPSADDEWPQIRWLRAYSEYLTPRAGLMSADTWTGIALYIRNLLVNWLIIGSLIGAVVAFPKVVTIIAVRTQHSAWWAWIYLLVFFAASLVGLSFVTRNRPSWRIANADQPGFLWRDLVPIGIAALAWMFFVTSEPATKGKWFSISGGGALQTKLWWLQGHHPWWVILLAASLYLLAWFVPLISARHQGQNRPSDQGWPIWASVLADLAAWLVGGVVFGVVLMLGTELYQSIDAMPSQAAVELGDPADRHSYMQAICVAPAWALLGYLSAEIVFLGLRSYDFWGDENREWFARSAGWYGVAGIGWMVLTSLVFFGAYSLREFPHTVTTLLPAGALSGMTTLLLSKSSWSVVSAAADGKKPHLVQIIIAIAGVVFAASLLIGISTLLDLPVFRNGASFLAHAEYRNLTPGEVGGVWAEFVGALILAAIGSYFVDINRFSLHAVYRNRLIRAFLGASNQQRSPDRFTGFDSYDNPRLHELWPRALPPGDQRPPFHVINATLNLVAVKNLAWQQRKAASFIMTPLASGSSDVGYRDTSAYGDPNGGISAGTAMAISGAAKSPNQGYNSSPAIGFLMTLFNVRLGWWLGNPGPFGEATYQFDGPRFALTPLIAELFGLTTDEHPYVYLSDGGHFEDLGLYEMVRRRCRFIILSDAGQDADFGFEDLGNAVRKIWIDLGVRIEFPELHRLRPRARARPGDAYAVRGTILYPEPRAPRGHILYIKPSFHGDEDAGIVAYALANPSFPHETTLNQWFNEAQFESYRSLGRHIFEDYCRRIEARTHNPISRVAQLF